MSAGQTGPTDLAVRRPGSAGALATAAMIGSAVCWGSATVMSKESLAHLPPFTLLVVQLIASVGFLWTAVAVGRTPVRLDAAARQAASCGVLEPGLAYAIGTSGLALTGAAHASLISATEPLLVVLVAWLLFRDAPGLRTLAAIGAAVAGVALVTVRGDGSVNTILGDGLIILATLFASLYVVITSRLSTLVEPLPLAALQQSVGLLFAIALLAVVLAFGFERFNPDSVPPGAWFLALASGVVQYALAFWLYLIGLRVFSVGAAALFLTLIPVFGAGGAVLFLGERLSPNELAGCGLVIAAVLAGARRAERV